MRCQSVDDRVLDLVLTVGPDQHGDPCRGDQRAAKRVLVGVLKRPGRVEGRLWREAGLCSDVLEHAGL